ncbi:MAG: ubiquinol-cytochrome C chaperone family protein [Azospirillaceae bacterium]
MFIEFGVPDTADGRWEAICLHTALVVERLRRAGPAGTALADTLYQVMFRDIDANLRELGVGDLAVPKRVRRMARAFNGRLAAYAGALERGNAAALGAVLDRNLLRDAAVGPATLAAVAGYVVAQRRALSAQPDQGLLNGEVAFAPDGATGSAEAAA